MATLQLVVQLAADNHAAVHYLGYRGSEQSTQDFSETYLFFFMERFYLRVWSRHVITHCETRNYFMRTNAGCHGFQEAEKSKVVP